MKSENAQQPDEVTRFVATMIEMASLEENEPPSNTKEHRAWRRPYQNTWNNAVPESYGIFPEPTAIAFKEADLIHLVDLSLKLVKSGILYSCIGSPLIGDAKGTPQPAA